MIKLLDKDKLTDNLMKSIRPGLVKVIIQVQGQNGTFPRAYWVLPEVAQAIKEGKIKTPGEYDDYIKKQNENNSQKEKKKAEPKPKEESKKNEPKQEPQKVSEFAKKVSNIEGSVMDIGKSLGTFNDKEINTLKSFLQSKLPNTNFNTADKSTLLFRMSKAIFQLKQKDKGIFNELSEPQDIKEQPRQIATPQPPRRTAEQQAQRDRVVAKLRAIKDKKPKPATDQEELEQRVKERELRKSKAKKERPLDENGNPIDNHEVGDNSKLLANKIKTLTLDDTRSVDKFYDKITRGERLRLLHYIRVTNPKIGAKLQDIDPTYEGNWTQDIINPSKNKKLSNLRETTFNRELVKTVQDMLSKGWTFSYLDSKDRQWEDEYSIDVAKKPIKINPLQRKRLKLEEDSDRVAETLSTYTKTEPMTIKKAMEGTNDFNNPEDDSRAYNTNCQRCVISYELRRRGYDVTAAPAADEDYGTMDKKEKYKQMIIDDPFRFKTDNKGWEWCFKDGAKDVEVLQGTQKKLNEFIEQRMLEWGNGARAICHHWFGIGSKTGHVVTIENNNGEILVVDGEFKGNFDNIDNLYDYMGNYHGYTKTKELEGDFRVNTMELLRTDNRELTTQIDYAVNEVSKKGSK